MHKRIIIIVFGLMLAAAVLSAGGEGTSGAVVLAMPMGARALGMSEAYAVSSGDVLGIHYNPACDYERQVSLLYQRGIADDTFGVIACGWRTSVCRLAASLTSYSAGEMELVNASGDKRTVSAERDFLLLASGGGRWRIVSLGFSGKWFYSRLAEHADALAYATDFGTVVTIRRRLGLGAALQNLGPAVRYFRGTDKLPLTARGGLSWRLLERPAAGLTASADAVKVNDSPVKMHLGAELKALATVSLRAGYRFGYDIAGLTCGLGVNRLGLALDYAWAAMSEFSSSQYIAVSYDFPFLRRQQKPCPLAEAQRAYDARQYERALSVLAGAECARARDEKVYILMGNAAMSLGRKKEALGYYLRALDLNPRNNELLTYVEQLQKSLRIK